MHADRGLLDAAGGLCMMLAFVAARYAAHAGVRTRP
jgi:hypothetical protein